MEGKVRDKVLEAIQKAYDELRVGYENGKIRDRAFEEVDYRLWQAFQVVAQEWEDE